MTINCVGARRGLISKLEAESIITDVDKMQYRMNDPKDEDQLPCFLMEINVVVDRDEGRGSMRSEERQRMPKNT